MRFPIALLLLAACAAEAETTTPPAPPSTDPPPITTSTTDTPPTGEVTPVTKQVPASNVIAYHGGWIVTWDPAVYFIYYGSWVDAHGVWGPDGNSAWLLEHFTSQLGGSAWFSINAWYGDAWGNHATNQVHFGGRAIDRYSRGTNLTGADIATIVTSSIVSGALPDDPYGIYVVLTSADVAEEGFCSRHCGWHTKMAWASNGADPDQRLYAFVGNAANCANPCGMTNPSPNDAPAGDAMVGVLAHELAEIVTDPYLDAWYAPNGQENADHCAWQFGQEYSNPNGAAVNVAIGDLWYLVQENWAPATPGYCTQGAW
jgi:hypothetical protein